MTRFAVGGFRVSAEPVWESLEDPEALQLSLQGLEFLKDGDYEQAAAAFEGVLARGAHSGL